MKNTVVVSPDLGNAKAASHFARILELPMAAGSKQRVSDDRVVIDTIVGDVDGKNVIVLDDEIANGGTIVEVLKKLRERRVKRISVACTHGLFTGKAIARLGAQPDIAEIVTTDTVPDSTGEAIAQHEDSVDCAAARGGDSTNPRREVGQRAV